ncbi:glutamate synthase [Cloacibacterium normanense]|uniref:Glutamate synthase n=1 Tax=Cloacibacterium normanense TaxID=237258 RepID=A0A2S7I561_9FLAO|nr:NAD(P)-binding protein [Cloacibacterium normanense]PPZ91707.1 glutamate synthase [Cloacibacterium normanense]
MSFIKTDLTKLANLNKSKGTGSIRKSKPEYVDFFPPCNNACPAGENIQAWLSLAQEGKIEDAWRKLTEQNPMAAIHGRVCYHPCENSCNRKDLDSSVSIHAVERFLGDEALKNNWQFYPPKTLTGKKIMIVGAGPSGLSAAYHLRKLGHEVTIFEAGPVAGGMMNFGIPAYRMPRNILQAEIKRIENFGVKIVLNYKVQDILQEKENGGFDAVFVAIGAHLAKKVNIPAQEASKILDAVSFLKEADENSDNKPLLGRRVAIYGGGNTAMDAARTAKRLGADEAMIIYRRDREHMPAHEFEADEALSEGVKIHWLSTIKNMETSSITVEKMQVVNGKAVPTGEYETLEADSLILALGQEADTDFLKHIEGITFKEDGTTVEVNPSMMTGYPGIFAGGDMVPSERTVTIATGHGKKAARNIDAWLRNTTYEKPANNPLVTIEKLQIWFKTDAEKKAQQHLEIEKAVETFDEIVAGYTTEEAVYEAQRCLSCGNCFECDSCYGACPEGAIFKNGKGEGYTINYDLCTGCGVCAEQCPCHALDMVLEH